MAPWRYPDYLPKPPHLMTVEDWEGYRQGLSKQQQSDRYSGITSDLIPTFEMIQAQGAGEIDPDPYKRGNSGGPGFVDHLPPNPWSTNKGIGQNAMFEPQTMNLDRFNSFGIPNPMDKVRQKYELAKQKYESVKSAIRVGKGAIDAIDKIADKSADVVEDKLGTLEDPKAVRLGLEWVTGTGPKERHLGEDSQIVAAIKSSPGVNDARNALYNKYDGYLLDGDSYTDYPFEFTWRIALRTKSATELFVGSFNVNMYVRDGRINFEASNRTSLDSLLFGTERRKRGMEELPTWEKGPLGNKYQYMSWSEPVVQRQPYRPNTA